MREMRGRRLIKLDEKDGIIRRMREFRKIQNKREREKLRSES